jgi:HlyD family secretion protein
VVRAPIAGRVLAIDAREGERLGANGLVEMGDTSRMYAVAEIYETDIGAVREGQRARVTSPALDGMLTGTVEAIGHRIGKLDVLGTDPVARTDARVVEVRIRLQGRAGVERLTNLQVEVEIEPGPEPGAPAGPGAAQ